MDFEKKMASLASRMFPNETQDLSISSAIDYMVEYLVREGKFKRISGARKKAKDLWTTMNSERFQQNTKDLLVEFFSNKETRKIIDLGDDKIKINSLLFSYSHKKFLEIFNYKDNKITINNIEQDYNIFSSYESNGMNKIFEYEHSFFYLYRLHSFEKSTLREVLIFGKRKGNSLLCTYYRYVPRNISKKNDESEDDLTLNDYRYVFAHKGSALVSAKGRVFCIFPPCKSRNRREQDSGFVALSTILDETVKGGIFTKLSDAGYEPAAGRFALEEMDPTLIEELGGNSENILKKVRSFKDNEHIHEKYELALNTKNHTTGESDNLLLFNPQYHIEIISLDRETKRKLTRSED